MKKMETNRWYFIGIHALLLITCLMILYAFSPSIRIRVADWIRPADSVSTVAHRGASGYAPENTMPAFQLALELNADYLELDIQLTKDKVPVIIHDPTVDRTTNGTGNVRDMTLEQIERLDAGSWFNDKYPMFARDRYANLQIPTLDQLFAEFGGRVHYLIEIKDPSYNKGIESLLNQYIERYDLDNKVTVQSFSEKSLKKIHDINPEIPLYQIVWCDSPYTQFMDISFKRIKSYAVGVSPNFQGINAAFVNQAKKKGLKVMIYTINYQGNMEKAIHWGADGVYTNYPDRFQEVLDKRKEETGF
ncbi:glycerophosphodiester phosphodiesterase [Paenibacillus spiritus]|nr:glycerophosphodiester phosphodiesterase [Paenibacillus spiritus]